MRETRKFTKVEFGHEFVSEAYTEDGGKTWRWRTNDSYCPLDACEEYGIPCDPDAQKASRDAQNAEFFAEYRRNYRGPSDEERFEARAAHGPGVELVNAITGSRWRT